MASQSIAPSSTVAAITPKMMAARNPGLLRFIASKFEWVGRVGAALVVACAALSCTETTAPVRRYPNLEDVGASDWQTVSVGSDHTCALKTNGNAYCWGSNRSGQLGINRVDTLCGADAGRFACSLTPQQVEPGLRFTAISAGLRHTCAITVQREAFCWGANDQGQVGGIGNASPALVRVPGALPWSQVSAGFTHSCGVRSDGALFCWGGGERGEIGNGSLLNAIVPARVPISEPVASVSAGDSRTCARTVAGKLYCWGATWLRRENGLEFSREQTTPELVSGAPAVSWVSVGSFTTCATDFSGAGYCWEANPRGGMGDGTLEGSVTPRRVAGDLEFVQISAGYIQTCGVVTSGAGYCWGDDSFGQLGVAPSTVIERCANQTLPCSTRPMPVIGRQSFIEISTGPGSHTCGVTTRGNLYCWGIGVSGQRGDGTMLVATSTPLRVVEPK